MPCTSPFPPTAQYHPSFSKIFIISKGAYQPGSSPSHTAGPSVLSLLSFYPHQFSIGGTCRQSCRVEAEHPYAQRTAYTTGVGSLPLLAPEANEPPTEEQLADQAKKAIEILFTLHTRMQETASVAANIMSAPEQAPRR